MLASVIDSVPFRFPSSVDVALELENATQPVPWEGLTWWFHGGGQKGSAGGKKNLPKIFTRQRTRFVTKTFRRDTLRCNKYVSRPFPRKGGNIQDLPSPRKDQLILLKIKTDGARRHLPQVAAIQT